MVVLDLTRLLPGPVASMMLRSLGARVIKVETPTAPDFLRFLPPHEDGVNVAFAALNAGKESVVIDLYSDEGAEVFRTLCSRADVLLSSARRPWMEARGLGFEDLSKENGRLISCTLGSYRSGSALEQKGGHDINFLAVSGFADLMKDAQGGPVLPEVQLADLGGAQYAVISVLAALLEREKTGHGRELHLSLEEGCDVYTMLARRLATAATDTTSVGPLSGQSPIYRFYRCADDKFIALGAIEPKFQARLKDLVPLDTSDWPDDLFFSPAPEVHQQLEEWFLSKNRAHWVDLFSEHDICFSPVLSIGEAERDESPLKAHFPSGETEGTSPLGGDTRSVLLEWGYAEEEIEKLAQAGLLVVS
jgi:alpha-methylacyl-CoA racemase